MRGRAVGCGRVIQKQRTGLGRSPCFPCTGELSKRIAGAVPRTLCRAESARSRGRTRKSDHDAGLVSIPFRHTQDRVVMALAVSKNHLDLFLLASVPGIKAFVRKVRRIWVCRTGGICSNCDTASTPSFNCGLQELYPHLNLGLTSGLGLYRLTQVGFPNRTLSNHSCGTSVSHATW